MIPPRQAVSLYPHANDSPPLDLTHLPNHILASRGRQYAWQGIGALSVKTFWKGRALYDVGDGHFAVDESSYLLLNHGQPYAITIDSDVPVESFCLFFGAEFAAGVLYTLSKSSARLLDMPAAPARVPACFHDRTYSHDDLLSPLLFTLRQVVNRGEYEALWLEEQFHEALERLARMHQRVQAEIDALPAVRAATREELYRRLHRARDYALAFLDRPVTLQEMAEAACLSPNHFLRTFRQLFHQSPHQYLTMRRLDHAQRLLRQSAASVTEICSLVGFESLGSFSSLFRRHVGVSPQSYRRKR